MKRLSVLFILLLLVSAALAQTPTTGSWSLLHTHTARTFDQGALQFLERYTKKGKTFVDGAHIYTGLKMKDMRK